MTVMPSSGGLRLAILGNKVDRTAATLPATATTTYFTISVGRVLLLGLIGEVTTIIQAQANNLKDLENPILLAGIKINTSPTDHRPLKQMQLQRFDGKRWVRFGPIFEGSAV